MQFDNILILQDIIPGNFLPGIGILPPDAGEGQLLDEIPVNRPGQVEQGAALFEQERGFQVRFPAGILV